MHPDGTVLPSSDAHGHDAWDLIILEARCNQAQTLQVIKLGRPQWSGCGPPEGPVPYLGTSLLFTSTS